MQHIKNTLQHSKLKENDTIIMEEEATLINNYLNSIKLVVTDIERV